MKERAACQVGREEQRLKYRHSQGKELLSEERMRRGVKPARGRAHLSWSHDLVGVFYLCPYNDCVLLGDSFMTYSRTFWRPMEPPPAPFHRQVITLREIKYTNRAAGVIGRVERV